MKKVRTSEDTPLEPRDALSESDVPPDPHAKAEPEPTETDSEGRHVRPANGGKVPDARKR